jgi:hypothetical protein
MASQMSKGLGRNVAVPSSQEIHWQQQKYRLIGLVHCSRQFRYWSRLAVRNVPVKLTSS